MQPPLVGEDAPAHKGLPGVGTHVGHLADIQGKLRELRMLFFRHAHKAHLELQVGNHLDQVAVARPLPVAVDGPLHVHGSFLDGRQRVGHRQARIVVRVDADRHIDLRPDVADSLRDLVGSLPPLVSQRTTTEAPPRTAALSVSRAYALSA